MQNFIKLLNQFEHYVRAHEGSSLNSLTNPRPWEDEEVKTRAKLVDDHRKILIACVTKMTATVPIRIKKS